MATAKVAVSCRLSPRLTIAIILLRRNYVDPCLVPVNDKLGMDLIVMSKLDYFAEIVLLHTCELFLRQVDLGFG